MHINFKKHSQKLYLNILKQFSKQIKQMWNENSRLKENEASWSKLYIARLNEIEASWSPSQGLRKIWKTKWNGEKKKKLLGQGRQERWENGLLF